VKQLTGPFLLLHDEKEAWLFEVDAEEGENYKRDPRFTGHSYYRDANALWECLSIDYEVAEAEKEMDE